MDKRKCVEDDNVEVNGETFDDGEVRKGNGKVEVGMMRKRFGLDKNAEVNRKKNVHVHFGQNSRSVAQRTHSQINPRIKKESTEYVNDRGKIVFNEYNDIHKKKTESVDRRNDEDDETCGGWCNDMQRVHMKNKEEKLTNRQFRGKQQVAMFLRFSWIQYMRTNKCSRKSQILWVEALKDETNQPVDDTTTLPSKFSFGSKQSSIPEKPKIELAEKELWDEFYFNLSSCKISSTGSNDVG